MDGMGQGTGRGASYAARSLPGALLAAALLAGCTGDPAGRAPGADPGPTPRATGTGPAAGVAAAPASPPTWTGRAELALAPGGEVFVMPSCTPGPEGTRACWGETAQPFERAGDLRPVVVTAAAAEPSADGLDWAVRLTVAAPSRGAAREVLAEARDLGTDVLLTDPDGDVLALATDPSADPSGGAAEVLLGGVGKPAAYALVERLRNA